MALSDTKLRTLKPASKVFSESDGGGLYIYGGYGSLSQVLIAHNHAGIDGGGVLAVNADFYMGYSQVEGNSAGTPLPIISP